MTDTIATLHAKTLNYAQGRKLQAQLNAVNLFWNTHLNYVPDSVAWGKKDHWPTIAEVIQQEQLKGIAMGDCTSYACLKQESLTLLNIEAFIVIGEINGHPHAWVESRNYILDNPPNKSLRHKKDRWDLMSIVKINNDHLYARSHSRDILQPARKYTKMAGLLDRRAETMGA